MKMKRILIAILLSACAFKATAQNQAPELKRPLITGASIIVSATPDRPDRKM